MTTTTQQTPRIWRLVPPGALAGVIAAICTTIVAATARAAGVSLEVQAEPIPLPAFAFWCLIGAAIGIVLARFLRNRRWFVIVTVVGTALSLIPPIVLPGDVATKAVLVVTHVVAAAIVIPILCRRFSPSASSLQTEKVHS